MRSSSNRQVWHPYKRGVDARDLSVLHMHIKKRSCEHTAKRQLPTSQEKRPQNATYLAGTLNFILRLSSFQNYEKSISVVAPHLRYFVLAPLAD